MHLLRQLGDLLLVVEVHEDDVLLSLAPYLLVTWRNGIARETLSSEVCVLCESLVHKRDTHIHDFPRRASDIVLVSLCEQVSVSTC